jgi:hypothetical protein
MELGDHADTVKFVLRDRDSRFTTAFDAVFAAAGIRILTSPPQAPQANAICERMIANPTPRTVRQNPDRQPTTPSPNPHRLPPALQRGTAAPNPRTTRTNASRDSATGTDRPRRLQGPPQTRPRWAHQRVRNRLLNRPLPTAHRPPPRSTQIQYSSPTGNALITVDPDKGALHEIGGRLELGPPKTPASARPIHLPKFLVQLLTEHAARQHHDHVFTGPRDGLLRRANFRDRIWQPAVAGNKKRGWAPIQASLTFHGLRHTHKTWLNEDHADKALQHQRLGHRMPGIEGTYSHVTQPMTEHMLTALDTRWRRSHHGHDDTDTTGDKR